MLTQQYLQECFNYNQNTGVLTWKHRPVSHFLSESDYKMWNKKFSGKPAGTESWSKITRTHYIIVSIKNKRYKAHRIAWMIVYGNWPDITDHINGDGMNNRIINLRDTDIKGNSKNTKIPITNTSGCVGVNWCKKRKLWYGKIQVNKKQKFLGYFIEKVDAIIVRKMAEYEHGFHLNHGRIS